jgi:hypothetical protein
VERGCPEEEDEEAMKRRREKERRRVGKRESEKVWKRWRENILTSFEKVDEIDK